MDGYTQGNGVAAYRIEEDPRWARVKARNGSDSGEFFYAVETTGVYCRPSCAARTPNPKNVRFYATPVEAEQAGFRACKRCRPNAQSRETHYAQTIMAACRLIETAHDMPSLYMLAEQAGLSPSHFHRSFKKMTGVTPKAYAMADRAHRMRQKLEHADTVTEAIYETGYNSSSRFYEASDAMLGMTPTAFRTGGEETEIRFAVAQSYLGLTLVAMSLKGVCAITMGDDETELERELQHRFPKTKLTRSDEGFAEVVGKIVAFVEKPELGLDLPLDIRGTAFQRRVWQALQQIPSGTTASYKDIAQRIGAPSAVRAVAGACASNALALAIPCHRVVKSDGSLSGYRWGPERKRTLLAREKGELALMKIPL